MTDRVDTRPCRHCGLRGCPVCDLTREEWVEFWNEIDRTRSALATARYRWGEATLWVQDIPERDLRRRAAR